jgi:hypothetical protein
MLGGGRRPSLYYASLRFQPFPLPSGSSRRGDNWSATGDQLRNTFPRSRGGRGGARPCTQRSS